MSNSWKLTKKPNIREKLSGKVESSNKEFRKKKNFQWTDEKIIDF